jgi:DNA-binding response OmpR family regulator
MMPEVDGLEFLKRCPNEGCDAAIVVMSAALHRRTLPPDASVDAFIEKPFGIERFLDTIAAHTGDGDGRRRMSRN